MRVSIHMMLLNAACVVARAVRSVRAFADEVCFVDTGSNDGTPDTLRRVCDELQIPCAGVAISATSRPDLYFSDVSSSYRRKFDTVFTGRPVLRDWSAARNLGLDLCQGTYVCKLDADDVSYVTPDVVGQVLDHLDKHPDYLAAVMPYLIVCDSVPGGFERRELYTRFWRRSALARFQEVCHENVDHLRDRAGTNWLTVMTDLPCFIDRRDSLGDGVRIPHRNFKVLLREYERLESVDEAPSAHLCMYLAEEAVSAAPELGLEVCEQNFRGLALCAEDAAWKYVIEAQCKERLGRASAEVMKSYAEAASFGSQRAVLLLALYRAKLSLSASDLMRARLRLSEAVALNDNLYYPRGASMAEVAEAKVLLASATRDDLSAPRESAELAGEERT